jgi:Transglutaminase-like superfamily
MSRLARLKALSPAQRRTLLIAWLWLPFFWLGLRVLGLPRLQVWLQRRPLAVRLASTLDVPKMQALGEAVNIAARYSPFPATCLSRSLLLGWLLRRCGVGSDLHIGVRMRQGVLEAHAWVEFAGVPVNDMPDIGIQFASFGDLIPLEAFQAP